MATLTITLGSKSLEVSQLTIRQLRDLRVGDIAALPTEVPSVFWDELYDICVKTVAVAVRETAPDLTEEEIWKLPGIESELMKARTDILVFAGMRLPEPTIAELRATIIAKEREVVDLKKTLGEREAKAKVTGE